MAISNAHIWNAFLLYRLCIGKYSRNGFLVASRKDYDAALQKYIEFSKAGGTKLFSQLVKEAGIAYPFGKGTLEELGKEILAILEELK